MQKHTKVYLKHFNIGEQDYIPSEISGSPATGGIHHIKFLSAGGKDEIENLIALTKQEHDQAHYKEYPYLEREELFEYHKKFTNVYKQLNKQQ
ncbi:MAG: HNH endonuclease signature motif containing protein [Nanoarchaeota archaeon]|jgi:5-methylcytosine-specific restriction endonuclease McrA|nr:HNH endonuclease signature motif containing protein [Nanoarchaeota archaeon]